MGRNLSAVILAGSLSTGYFKNNWSDIDILIVVENLDLKIKQTIAKAKIVLEKKYKKHFGLNVVTINNVTNPISPEISLDGKVLQSLLEIKEYPERILFLKRKDTIFYSPTKKETQNYSLSNIAMFLLRNRKTMIEEDLTSFYSYKKAVSKEVRAAFIITKLAIQYFTLYSCGNNDEIINKAEQTFKGFKFSTLKENQLLIENWSTFKKKAQLSASFYKTDKFIENFTYYIFQKIKSKSLR